jgi:hypothetical protein
MLQQAIDQDRADYNLQAPAYDMDRSQWKVLYALTEEPN